MYELNYFNDRNKAQLDTALGLFMNNEIKKASKSFYEF